MGGVPRLMLGATGRQAHVVGVFQQIYADW